MSDPGTGVLPWPRALLLEVVKPKILSNGVEIHCEVRGEGPAVLFHTGAGGHSRIWEAGYMDALRFRKILMDQRGRGRSDRPTSVDAH